MRASLFLIIYAVIAIVFVSRIVSVLFSRPKPKIGEEEGSSEGRPRVEFFDFISQGRGFGQQRREKVLNCHFQHLGKVYDAYEVLGLPAGAPQNFWQEAFQKKLQSQGASSDLLEAAIKALKSARFS